MRLTLVVLFAFVAYAYGYAASSFTGASATASTSVVYVTGGTCGTSSGSLSCASSAITDSSSTFRDFAAAASVSFSGCSGVGQEDLRCYLQQWNWCYCRRFAAMLGWCW